MTKLTPSASRAITAASRDTRSTATSRTKRMMARTRARNEIDEINERKRSMIQKKKEIQRTMNERRERQRRTEIDTSQNPGIMQDLINQCIESASTCNIAEIMPKYIYILEHFFNNITINPCEIEPQEEDEEEDEDEEPKKPYGYYIREPGGNYFICDCIKKYLNYTENKVINMNIYGCATSSKIMAVLLLLLMGGIITVNNLMNDDKKTAKFIGTVLQNFNPEAIGEFFYGFYSPREYQLKLNYLQHAYNYFGLKPGINILGILFKIGGDFPGIAPSHFICLYMNNDGTGYNISSWVGNGVSKMKVTHFNIETLNDYVRLLTNNHMTDISDETKIEIARFFNDPQANVDHVHANNVFIKPGRQYFIFIMPQSFIMDNILRGVAPGLAASASAPASESMTNITGGSKRRQKQRRSSSSFFSKKRKTKKVTLHTRRRRRRQGY